MDFTGEKCAACGQAFTEDDDVVVCPECGSPHHRSCYLAENKCANEGLHAQGFLWKREQTAPAPEVIKEEKDIICDYCGQENAPGEIFCSRCGNRLDDEDEDEEDGLRGWNADNIQDILNDPYLGFDPKEDMGGASLEEVTEFIGPNRFYYLPLFKRMKDLGSKLSFNLICFILPPFYFANRRMWLWAVLSALLMIALGMPAALSLLVNDGGQTGYQIFPAQINDFVYENRYLLNLLINACSILDLVMRVVLCAFGNWMYFRHALRSIKNLKSVGAASKENVAAVGGVRPLNILLMAVIFFAIAFIALYGLVFAVEFIYVMFAGV